MKISILNFGMGNTYSVANALKKIGADFEFVNERSQVQYAEKIILPGVGNFSKAMKSLKERELDDGLIRAANNGTPILGICLGQQLLMEKSEESEDTMGLGLIEGEVKYFFNDKSFQKGKVPNIGWRRISSDEFQNINTNKNILKGIDYNCEFYFVHSLFVKPSNKRNILSSNSYFGVEYCTVVMKNNIYGCQFHPEKSGPEGLKILNNFINL